MHVTAVVVTKIVASLDESVQPLHYITDGIHGTELLTGTMRTSQLLRKVFSFALNHRRFTRNRASPAIYGGRKYSTGYSGVQLTSSSQTYPSLIFRLIVSTNCRIHSQNTKYPCGAHERVRRMKRGPWTRKVDKRTVRMTISILIEPIK